MTENEVIEVLSDFNKCVCVKADGAYETDEFIKAKNAAIQALEEIQEYREIGTVEEVKSIVNLGIWGYKKGYANAIDEAIDKAAKAICIGCGYLKGHECTYKGANCGVSKPMLEVVVKALEQMKAGVVKSNKCYTTTCDHNNVDNTCMFGDAGERKCCVKEGGIDG